MEGSDFLPAGELVRPRLLSVGLLLPVSRPGGVQPFVGLPIYLGRPSFYPGPQDPGARPRLGILHKFRLAPIQRRAE